MRGKINVVRKREQLISKLVHEGIARADAMKWKLHAVSGTTNRYTYTHEKIGNVFRSLTAAKLAHIIRARKAVVKVDFKAKVTAKEHTLRRAGSDAAIQMISSAKWIGVRADVKAIGLKYAKLLDVVIVDTKRFKKFKINPKHWNMNDLVGRHKFFRAKRPSIIIEKHTKLIIGLMLTGLEVPKLTTVIRKLPTLHSSLHGRMALNTKRPGLCMFGYRWNTQWCCTVKSRRNLATGYYCAKSVKHAIELWRDKAAKALVVKIASSMCRLERAVAPAMGAHRVRHASMSKHPGIWPGESISACPAPCLGVSQGYVSEVHRDRGFMSMSEMIVWNSAGVAVRSGYCFALVDAGVVFDLISPRGVMCMVPGSVRHGTPGLNRGFTPDHTGIGAVILNKTNLATPQAIACTELIRLRLEEDAACNPFIARFSINDELECELCWSLSSTLKNPMYICHECHSGYHAKCLTPRPFPAADEAWFCPTCTPLVEAAGL